jgi:glycosyltransferase involved in cell wall biosynthesis
LSQNLNDIEAKALLEMEKIRIMHLISSSAFFGAERVVAELSKYSQQCGVETVIGVFVQDQTLIDSFGQAVNDSDVHIISFDGSSSFNWNVIKAISSAIEKHQINILHSHGYKSDLYASIVRRIFKTKVGLIATNHNWIGMTKKELVYQFLDSCVLRGFDFVIAVSQAIREQMIEKGIKQAKIDIINNGIDVEDADFSTSSQVAREKLGLAPNDYIIGCVARLTLEKAHIDLINAFSEIAKKEVSVKLVLIGDGPERSSLENECRKLDIVDKVIFTGNRSDVRSLYAAFDTFALVSRNEGLPMVLLEAMAAELPIVATRVGAIPKVIREEQNGLLVNSANRADISTAFLKLYRSSQYRKNLGKEARKTVVEQFSSKKMAEKYTQLYKKILSIYD